MATVRGVLKHPTAVAALLIPLAAVVLALQSTGVVLAVAPVALLGW